MFLLLINLFPMRYLVLIVLLTPFSLLSQTNRIPAAVILKTGSKLEGYVINVKHQYTPTEFKFYTKSDTELMLTTENTASLEFGDFFYKTTSITLYHNTIDESALTESEDEQPFAATVFIKRLLKGDVLSLYELKDRYKTHYIIEDTAGKQQSLRYLRYYNNESGLSVLREERLYRSQLLPYANNNETKNSVIAVAGYSLTELVKVLSVINTESIQSKETQVNVRKRKVFYPYLSAYGQYMRFKYLGYNRKIAAMSFQPLLSPRLQAGIEVRMDKDNKFVGEIHASFYSFSFAGNTGFTNLNGQKVTEKYEVAALPTILGVSVNYALARFSNSKILVGIGYNIVANNYKKNNYTTNEFNTNGSLLKLDQISLSKSWQQYFFQAEYSVNQKLGVNLMVAPSQDFSTFFRTEINQSNLAIGVKYRFTNNKKLIR
jgi:hypothetical protein